MGNAVHDGLYLLVGFSLVGLIWAVGQFAGFIEVLHCSMILRGGDAFALFQRCEPPAKRRIPILKGLQALALLGDSVLRPCGLVLRGDGVALCLRSLLAQEISLRVQVLGSLLVAVTSRAPNSCEQIGAIGIALLRRTRGQQRQGQKTCKTGARYLHHQLTTGLAEAAGIAPTSAVSSSTALEIRAFCALSVVEMVAASAFFRPVAMFWALAAVWV